MKITLLSWRRYSGVTDHGYVRGNSHDYANGFYNGYGHNNGNFPGQRISNGNDKGNDNGKCNGDVTWRSRRGNDVSISVATHHVSMTVTFFSL